MGEVYLGEKVGPEGFVKPVVLKCVLPQLAKDRAFVQLFLDEARLAALLNHPNIAQIYDFGVVDNIYYMAMEYVPGYTVDDLRRKHASIDKLMPIEHIACVASQSCQGLHYAHALADARGVSLGLVHRDVSPHNLIVSVDGGLKIVDFGIAKARAGLTRVQAKGAVGKFGYMSPEQSRGEQVDARTDVFSLGVCLWELVTNRRLHDAKIDRPPAYDPKRPIPPVTSFRRDVPRQFERILETALAIDKEERYATCQEMHLDIERFLAAMTHYAGQAALANYLKDLVEGRVEAPPEQKPQGITVGPVNGKSSAPKPADNPHMLEGAQRYEEVFGVAPDRGQPTPSLKAVPASWDTRRPSANVSLPPPGPDDHLEVKTGRTPVPKVGVDKARAERLARAEQMARRSSGGSGRVVGILIAVLVLGAAGAGFLYRAPILAFIHASIDPPPPPAPKNLSATYRVLSSPEGAEVWLDGEKKGSTPQKLELNPGLEYRIDVKKEGLATKSAMLKASVDEAVRDLSFKLEAAASARITSSPPGASIEVNGFPVYKVTTPATLADLAPGKEVRVVVKIPSKPPKLQSVELIAGKTAKLHFDFDEH